MYLSIQEYAAQKLRTDRSPTQEATPLMEARRRHAAYFAQLGTEKHLASIRIRGGLARQRRLRCELENLLVGARMALADKSGELAANCAIAAAESGAALGVAEGLLGRVLDEVEMETPKTARLLNARGWLLNQLGKNDEALEQLQQALAIHRELGNRQGEGYVVSLMAVVYRHQGRIEEAVAANQQALALHRETGNRRGEGIIVGNLAILYGNQGRIEEALDANQQALVLFREASNRVGEAIIHGNIGELMFEAGDLKASEDHIQQAMAIGAESDFSQSGVFLGSLAMIRAHEGAFDEARTLLDTGEEQLHGTSALEFSRLLCKRARVEILAGEMGAATDALDKAQVVGSDIGRGPSSKLTEDIAEIRQLLDTNMASED
jgi:tetratricopeptide (TPR) repeat protein